MLPVGVKHAKVWEQFGADLVQSWCQHRKREALHDIAGMGIIAPAVRGLWGTDAKMSLYDPLSGNNWERLVLHPCAEQRRKGDGGEGRAMVHAGQEDFCSCHEHL